MLRIVRTAILCLLLGVVVNVAVAWGCALWAPIGRVGYVPFRDRSVLDRVVELPPDTSFAYREDPGSGINMYTILWHQPGRANAVVMIEAGWPIPSMYAQVRNDGTVRNGIVVPVWLRPGRFKTMPRPLPMRPLARGFIINSFVATALVCLTTVVPWQLRRRLRAKRGRCSACGYDLRGADHECCPECGVATAT